MVMSPVRPVRLSPSATSRSSPSLSSSSSTDELVCRLERQLAYQQELNATLQRLVMSQQFFSAEHQQQHGGGVARFRFRLSTLRLAGVGVLSGVAGFLVAVLAFVLLCM